MKRSLFLNFCACLSFFAVFSFLISCGIDSDDPAENSSEVFTISGTVVDQTNTPLSGVRVTAGGIAAQSLSDDAGNFTITSPFAFQDSEIYTARSPGFDAYFSDAINTPDEVVRTSQRRNRPITMIPQPAPGILTVHSPVDNTNIALNGDCTGEINVSGVAMLKKRENFLLDVVFLIDASGSANEEVSGNQTVFDIELKAVKKVLAKLSHDVTRIGIVRFASDAVSKHPLTSDFNGIEAIINDMQEQGPEPYGQAQSGTNFNKAITTALDAFTNTPLSIQSSDLNTEISLSPQKLIVLLSDGIPTLPQQPGISQQKEDLDATLDAAVLAREQNVMIYTYAIGLDEEDKLRSALPSISDITEGQYVDVGDMGHLEIIMPEKSLVGMGTVFIKNLETNTSTNITPSADGLFSTTIPVVAGPQILRITAFDFYNYNKTTIDVQINGIPAAETGEDAWGISETPILTAADIRTPAGDPVNTDELFNLFIQETGEYPDIRETVGTEVFMVPGEPGETVTITGELFFKHACYNSDIGYLIVNPLSPESSALQAFAAATQTNVLINTSAIGTSCDAQFSEPGNTDVSFSFTVASGSYLVFFMIPDGSLSEARSGNKSVLYTLSSLNPGGFDQALTFYSENGRRNAGTPHTIFSFEDVPLIYQSDSDYGDIVFNLEGILPWRIAHECLE